MCQRPAPVEEKLGVGRPLPDEGLAAGKEINVAVEETQDLAQLQACVAVVRVDGERHAERAFRLVAAAKRRECRAELVLDVGAGRRTRLSQHSQCVFVAAEPIPASRKQQPEVRPPRIAPPGSFERRGGPDEIESIEIQVAEFGLQRGITG
jgi:hypothetical protein